MPEFIRLNDHRRGDTWPGILSIGPVTFLLNDSDVSLPENPLASCRMQFRDKKDVLGYELSTSPEEGQGTITIVDADSWLISVPAQALPLDGGSWLWDFEATDSAGWTITLYEGKMTVRKDITHD